MNHYCCGGTVHSGIQVSKTYYWMWFRNASRSYKASRYTYISCCVAGTYQGYLCCCLSNGRAKNGRVECFV